MIVLEETRRSIVFVEHDPMLYVDAAEMVDYVSRALSDAGKESAVLLCFLGSARASEMPDIPEGSKVFRKK